VATAVEESAFEAFLASQGGRLRRALVAAEVIETEVAAPGRGKTRARGCPRGAVFVVSPASQARTIQGVSLPISWSPSSGTM
jgi:hypothetical protein